MKYIRNITNKTNLNLGIEKMDKTFFFRVGKSLPYYT